MDYGITNTTGIVSNYDLESIEKKLRKHNINLLDTSIQYGKSLDVIGFIFNSGKFSVISKIAPKSIEDTISQIDKTISAISHTNLTGLLIHNPDEFLASGNGYDIYQILLEYQEKGIISEIGVSVYDETQLLKILEIFEPKILQLPLNILNSRLYDSSTVKKLDAIGCEIHARSLFLQGALLSNPKNLPEKLKALQPVLENLDRIGAEVQMSRIELILNMSRTKFRSADFVLGITTFAELDEIISVWEQEKQVGELDFKLPELPSSVLDPRSW